MDLTQSVETASPAESAGPNTEQLLVTNCSYEIEEIGHRVDTPVLHLQTRRADGSKRELTVEGFRPYFAIRHTDALERLTEVANDRRVLGIEMDCSTQTADALGLSYDGTVTPNDIAAHLTNELNAVVHHTDDPFATQDGDPVARVFTRVPGDVGGDGGMRGDLDCDTFEADIPFPRRFLISAEIYQGVRAPVETDHRNGPDRVVYENWAGDASSDDTTFTRQLSPCDPPDIDARMVVYDIEVATEGEGFPDPAHARHPITAIAGYDSYTGEYRLWGLMSNQWEANGHTPEQISEDVEAQLADRDGFPDTNTDSPDPDVTSIKLFANETQLLSDFHDWVLECDPDIFTGYNADGFDTPYLIQRSYNRQARRIKQYSNTGDPGVWVEEYNGERQVNFALSERVTLDILDAYKKTQFRELDSYKLDDVAEAELGYGKTGLAGDELDAAWHENPVDFFVYNIRDTQATVGVERESGLLDLFENLREVTGAPYETAVSNGPMLDTMFLRRAYEQRTVLPSNTEPDEGVYHGAKVFETKPGVHANSVYPDLSSMYPNLFAMLNLGENTIIGGREALEASEYTEADCYQFPVDNRPFAEVPKGDSIDHVDRDEYKGVKTPKGGVRAMFDPQYDWEYVLKPDIEESFIRDIVDDLIAMKGDYSGAMYAAVKRVVNSVYGVLGDSASGGKGSRLYNRKIAEGITLAGRLTITHTAELFTDHLRENYDEDAYLVGGDTDSSVSAMPNAPSLADARRWAQDGCEVVDESYDEFVQETFGFAPGDTHRLHVELESLASKLFYLGGDETHTYTTNEQGMLVSEYGQESVKKRYAQHIVWDDDDGWLDTPDAEDYPGDPLEDTADLSALKDLDTVTFETYESGPLAGQDPHDNVGIKGFEYVRSDSAQITRDAQLEVLTNILLMVEPKDAIETYLRDMVDRIEAGEVPLSDLARPKGIGQQLDAYGWTEFDELADRYVTDEAEEHGGAYVQTPGPTYRGAKYADDHFPWEQLGEGSKPLKIPIAKVRSDEYPEVYEYDTYPEDGRPESPEVERPVDAIAVERPSRLPDGFEVDMDAIIQKELEEKLEDILTTIGLDWDDMLTDGTQVGLDAFA